MTNLRVEDTLERADLLSSVIKLWRANSATLGFLPKGAFEDAADKGQILVATSGDAVAGYLMYGEHRGYARITHLCVSPSHRGQGVADRLFARLKVRVTNLAYITLNCRRDYVHPRKMWERLGFECERELPGRSRDGSILEEWRYLLSSLPLLRLISERSPHFHVVVDCNVFSDLIDEEPQNLAADWVESNALLADAFAGVLRVEVVKETRNEVSRIEDDHVRAARLAAFDSFRCREYDPERARELEELLKQKIGGRLSRQDLSDIRQVAKAAASDADAFVTRDEVLLSRSALIEPIVGIPILRPLEVLLRLDEDERPATYQPIRLAGTSIQRRLLGAGDVDRVTSEFIDYGRGETKAQLRARLQTLLTNSDYEAVIAEGGGLKAIWIAGTSEPGRLHVPVLRARAPRRLATTAVVHILWSFLRRRTYPCVIQVDEPYLDDSVVDALGLLDFVNVDGGWLHIGVDGVVSPSELAATVNLSLPNALPPTLDEVLASLNSPESIALAERLFFPVKVERGLLPSFVVPIRPEFARDLFDTGLAAADLFGVQDDALMLSLENVYYRSAHHSIVNAPGRVFWYVKTDKRIPQSGSIRAVSQIREVVTGPATSVFSRFERLGVYRWEQVRDTAGGPHEPIRAFRFSHTEMLSNPIDFKQFQEIAKSITGKTPSLQSPWAVKNDELFRALYEIGTQKDDDA